MIDLFVETITAIGVLLFLAFFTSKMPVLIPLLAIGSGAVFLGINRKKKPIK